MKKQEIIQALEAIEPGLSNKEKEVLDQSRSFVFQNQRVISYNDEVSVSHPLPLNIEGAVNAEALLKMLKKLKGNDLEISTTESELIIKEGKTISGIKLSAEIKIPIISVPTKWNKLPADFCKAIKQSKFSCSADYSRPMLTCVHVNSNIVESCDNFRLYRQEMKEEVKEEFNVPANAIDELVKREPISYNLSEEWVNFLCKNEVVFSCRRIVGKYPDLSSLVKVEGKHIKFPSEMVEILERVGVMSRKQFKQDERLEFSLADGIMKVKGSNEIGWAEETVEIQYKGKELKFMVNTDFIIEACSILNELTVGENKIKMEGDNFIHIVLLVTE